MILSRSLTSVLALTASLLASLPATAEMTLDPGTSVTFHHHDLLGSPVMVSDHKGRVLWYENTKPYGESLGKKSSSGLGHLDNTVNEATSNLGCTGHTVDSSTGLVYMKARHYDPVIGRFYSNDPVAFTALNTTMFNRYAYANNNPYLYIDPDGEAPIDPEQIARDYINRITSPRGYEKAAVQTAQDVKQSINTGATRGSLAAGTAAVALTTASQPAAGPAAGVAVGLGVVAALTSDEPLDQLAITIAGEIVPTRIVKVFSDIGRGIATNYERVLDVGESIFSFLGGILFSEAAQNSQNNSNESTNSSNESTNSSTSTSDAVEIGP